MTPQEQQERGAQFVADLRAMADLFEREPSLPLPYCVEGTGFPREGDAEQNVAAVFAAAQLLGTEVVHDRVHGTLTTKLVTGLVRYTVYAKVGAESRREDVVTVASPADVLGAKAVAA